MKKIIKKWGNSLVIRFSPDDVSMFGLREGDVVDIADMFVMEKKRGKRGK